MCRDGVEPFWWSMEASRWQFVVIILILNNELADKKKFIIKKNILMARDVSRAPVLLW